MPSIEGFCQPEVIDILDQLDALPINKKGGVCEIGVHHGQYYIMMNQLISANEQSYAIDVFDWQHLNIDGSGAGNRAKFEENLRSFDLYQGNNTTIIQGDSTDYSLGIRNAIKPGTIRFFSVDGGHTPEHALNDLNIANDLINLEGLVIVDDAMNHWWPGVLEGTLKFINSKPTLVPVALGFNKLYMCKMSFKQYYLEQFMKMDLPGPKQIRDFFGHSVATFKYWSMMPF